MGTWWHAGAEGKIPPPREISLPLTTCALTRGETSTSPRSSCQLGASAVWSHPTATVCKSLCGNQPERLIIARVYCCRGGVASAGIPPVHPFRRERVTNARPHHHR